MNSIHSRNIEETITEEDNSTNNATINQKPVNMNRMKNFDNIFNPTGDINYFKSVQHTSSTFISAVTDNEENDMAIGKECINKLCQAMGFKVCHFFLS